ncbi:MAG: M36 family metallopeptidase [Candidatus Aenigmatarchaeota archaeon]
MSFKDQSQASTIVIFIILIIVATFFTLFQASSPSGYFRSVLEPIDSGTVNKQIQSIESWDMRMVDGFPKTLSGGEIVYSGIPEQKAEVFVTEHSSLFGIGYVENVLEQNIPGGNKITFRQMENNLPVIDSYIGVIVSGEGVVYAVSSTKEIPRVSPFPSITPEQSLEFALADIGASEVLGKKVTLSIFPSDPPRLSYEIFLSVDNGYIEPWRFVVDAHDGSILLKSKLVLEVDGQVFDPNPIVKLNDDDLRDTDPDEDFENAYFVRELKNLDPPVGGLYSLTGKYVNMTNMMIPTNYPPTSPDNFIFPRSDKGFEEVMGYYHINRNQEYIQSLGFEILNMPIRVDAHGLFNMDSSSYFGEPFGAGYIALGDGGVDDAEDADIIIHEYGHAIQDNQTVGIYFGRNNNGYGDETGAMSEGFGDYWAFSVGYEKSQGTTFETYIGEWDAKGYTDPDTDELTPGDYLRRVNENKYYPSSMVGKKHNDSEIWSRSLYDIFTQIGKEKTDRIVLYSHYLVPTNPDFEDGAFAIVDANEILYPAFELDGSVIGLHHNEICISFVARGILTSTECPNIDDISLCYADEVGCTDTSGLPYDHFCSGHSSKIWACSAEETCVVTDGEFCEHGCIDGVCQETSTEGEIEQDCVYDKRLGIWICH